ncbi:Cerebral protein [Operophtera brumata]|uniref:Ribosomal RNA-processing protein 8 n=1 Tax=Operophtera brumata TaxID=104452 RepID=A0A0L7LAP4_OPEBR|nr:Cerebral protein [Operophtera brumata]
MVFAIPDWEDAHTNKNTVFGENAKLKQQKVSTKKSPQKKTNQKKVTLNGVAEKSKLIKKEDKKQLRRQQLNNTKSDISKKEKVEIVDIGKHKNVLKTKRQTGKVNVVAEESNTLNKQKQEKSRKRNLKKNKSDSSVKVENIDTDKLDEVLLNAKKNKFNEALIRDDVEAILFKEDKCPEGNKKMAHRQIKQEQVNQEDLLHRKNKNSDIDNKKTQKQTKNNKMLKAKNAKNNSISKAVNNKGVFKVKPTANGHIDNNNEPVPSPQTQENNKFEKVVNKPSLKTRQEKKKDKIKLILKEETAQFRFLNETLYTSSGSEASQLFQDDPTAFQNYHQGYQQQVKKWPAALAQQVPHSVRSFDLVAASPRVEACDMAHTPLLTGSVDAVVYCLALMGTDLTTYLLEANRVLKIGLVIYLSKNVTAFSNDVSRLGFKLVKLDAQHEVFFFMEFVKNQEPPVKKAKLPVLTLKPCIYKRR